MRSLAVIIAASRASAWLEACLTSVREAAGHWALYGAVEIRLGVDGCSATAATCAQLRVPYWWSETNVGPYVLRNSLVDLARADAYVMFDADDVMRADALVQMGRALAQGHGIVGPSRFDCTPDLVAIGQRQPYVNGVCAIAAATWEELGGYQGERYGADADFIARAGLAGIQVRAIDAPLYYRRVHPGSLTQDPATGPVSPARLEAAGRMAAARDAHGWRIRGPRRTRVRWVEPW